ncbi:predicted protein [Naegleria gruberi]|uniref:Predicted protein n=1 Tax=Naegleria gruberi TaxID=5762 RepID=D2VRL2_NAEGR|nr:uncharacterized protein NAEGRDRAFT_71625 [Naegleria gruberi]EFC40411.1 predicted protein [Naegleria gruberi]|eukprot:XP_002673155.1 predicted protein [Naegleria gruberi strain NEG-M]
MSRDRYADQDDDYEQSSGGKNDKIQSAEARIELNKYDTEAWTILLSEVQEMSIIQARPYYERFFEIYPVAARYWKIYAEHELKAKNHTLAEEIFKKALDACPNFELWRFYLDYIREHKRNDVDTIRKAFDICKEKVGLDISSSTLWIDNIKFIKDLKATDQNDIQNQINLLRSLYQEAIQIPMHDIEKIWKDYEIFENEVNPTNGKSTLQEFAPKFKLALNKYKEKKNIRENMGGVGGLLLNMLATPPTNSEKERSQKQIWKDLIELEKRNSQRLTADELKRRVLFVYSQCFLCFRHHPDIWYDAANYLISIQCHDEATIVFQRGCNALLPVPKSLDANQSQEGSILLHLAFSEYLESRKLFDEAAKVFKTLITSKHDPLVFIQYIRFMRRTKGTEGAREAFIEVKKSPKCTYHVWVASALLEYTTNNQPETARKFFKLGQNQPFGKEPGFILEYLKFLDHLNDKNNSRVLFETILNELPKEQSSEIWNRFLQFEYSIGDLNSIEKVEQRKLAAFSENAENNTPSNSGFENTVNATNSLINLINRSKFLDLWPCTPSEMELLNLKAQESEKVPTEDDIHIKYSKSFYRVDYTKQIMFTNTRQQNQGSVDKLNSNRTAPPTVSLPPEFNKFRQYLNQKRLFLPDFKQMCEFKVIPNHVSQSNSSLPLVTVHDEQVIPHTVLQILRRMPQQHFAVIPPDYVINALMTTPLPPPPESDLKRGRNEYENVDYDQEYDDEGPADRAYDDIYTKRRKQRK